MYMTKTAFHIFAYTVVQDDEEDKDDDEEDCMCI